ncbi:hypothetical protein [Phytophthora cinnamomi ormycovirus 6-4]|uniref:Uncharacterized protein n=1 Tax=Phytophthora cinnamomi ormycovirus 6-4 TaxID=3239325 RepID=A0AB39J8F6_9VIRU
MAELSHGSAIYTADGGKPSVGQIVSARHKAAEAHKSRLLVQYHAELADKKITEKDINALSEIMSYVNDSPESLPERLNLLSPAALYSWAAANSSIAFPYVSLKDASEKVKSNLEAYPMWGKMPEGNYLLPSLDSLDDSHMWMFLRSLADVIFAGKVQDLSDLTVVPSLDNSQVEKNQKIKHVLVRVNQLIRNPLSATIRQGVKLAEEDMVKNAVDFIVLEYLFTKLDRWKNLSISVDAIRQGRRPIPVEHKDGKGRVSITTSYVGHKLADYIGEYVHTRTSKSLDSEPLFVLIQDLILNTLKKIEVPMDYELPKSFLESPSYQVRRDIRKGPSIKTRKGIRENLYSPFSFVKSSECSHVPVDVKKDATDLSSEILLSLDKINKLSPSHASKNIEAYKEVLKVAYIASDTFRLRWRKDHVVPDYRKLTPIFRSMINSDNQVIEEYIDDVRSLISTMSYRTVANSEAEEIAIIKAISEATNKRKKAVAA